MVVWEGGECHELWFWCWGIDVPHRGISAVRKQSKNVNHPLGYFLNSVWITRKSSHSIYQYFYIDTFLPINFYRYIGIFFDMFLSIFFYRYICTDWLSSVFTWQRCKVFLLDRNATNTCIFVFAFLCIYIYNKTIIPQYTNTKKHKTIKTYIHKSINTLKHRYIIQSLNH
jgi:hypothetical protein